ncbi:MAG: DUF1501 domain-containing protein [Verrucomicrobiales bacterium]
MTSPFNRRSFLRNSTLGIGSLALTRQLMADGGLSSQPTGAGVSKGAIKLHHAPTAKRVIFLCMAGGPSHLETYDYKQKLADMDGQPMPDSFTKGQPIAQLQGQKLKCLGPQHGFKRYGQSGQHFSEILPNIGKIADDIAIIRSMTTMQINHDPAHTFMNTGTQISGRPCMGSWVQYGLGSESEDLPGFVVLTSSGGGQDQPIASRHWHSGFLPSKFQGVHFHSKGDPVLYVGSPGGVTRKDQRSVVDAVNALNRERFDLVDDPEIATRISQYEMAFQMQSSVPELMDLSDEPADMLELHGANPIGTFASNCSLARRSPLLSAAPASSTFITAGGITTAGIKDAIKTTAGYVDKATYALITDLKQRDMLKDTLVVWGGEFGRTPMAQGNGRDHHIKGFSIWMAGGGIKGGISHGATDELGYNAVEDVVSVHDFHATLLHLLGIQHDRFTYKYQGLDFKLTGVEPSRVVKEILA